MFGLSALGAKDTFVSIFRYGFRLGLGPALGYAFGLAKLCYIGSAL